jgi:signal transduction histidine kinase
MLVALWAVSILLAWTILVVGWLMAGRKLERLHSRVITDVKALDEVRQLELAVFAHQREDLLWQSTGQAYHRQRSTAHQDEAERIVGGLDVYVTTPSEDRSLADIRAGLKTLRDPTEPSDSMEAGTQSVYKLLEAVDQFEAENERQMEESIRVSDHLRATMDGWAVGLLACTAGLLAAGALIVSRRVVRPTLALTHAANAFGGGDFSARTPVFHNDEMGVLAQTFNNMAADIADREQDRLRFVAMVAHDLKNPVLAVEMAVRLLRGAADEQRRGSYLDAMTDEVRRLRTIVRDLSDDIQVASGRFQVRKAEVNLCALIRKLLQTQSVAFASHQILLELSDACMVLGDAGRIERVVTNLVSNAVKYSPAGTRVTVRVEPRESFALLSVCDQGPGISREDAKVLFQPFGRGRSADTMAEGTGLGLYVVKQIVEAHGGLIEADSEPGQGTVFRVKLPLALADTAQDREPK